MNIRRIVYLLQGTLWILLLALCLPTDTIGADIHLTLPKYRIQPEELAVVVNDQDPLSVRIGEYYIQARKLPRENLLRLAFDPQANSLPVEKFKKLRQSLLSKTPAHIQAYALTWLTPYRVGCMSMTSAVTFGFDKAWCSAHRCATTRHSPYYNYADANPAEDLSLRPAMTIAAKDFALAKELIDRGVLADSSLPEGTAYLVSTSDKHRNVRAIEYPRIKKQMQGWLVSEIVRQNNLRDRNDVLFYFTGSTRVSGLETLHFRPGAIADHLTSTGGQLSGSRQMSALAWLEAGASGSYGTVVEPCNHRGKFPSPSRVMEHYGSGSTLIEAYWKSVQQPGEGIFIGDPLAAPFDHMEIVTGARETKLRTRNLRPGKYQLTHATSPVGPFTPISTLLVKYHQKELMVPPLGEGFYRLQLLGKKPET